MNSQIFNTQQNSNSNLKQTVRLTVGSSMAVQWLSAFLLIVAVILFPERPAWGGDMDLHVSSGSLRGYAHQAALEDVLQDLADEGDNTFYFESSAQKP
jgi:hypothetical protein